MTKAHAKLSASGASRWMGCPASVKLEEGYPDQSSPFAREGTAAHELAERALRDEQDADNYIGIDIEVEGEVFTVDNEMTHYVQEYIDYVRNVAAGAELIIESRVDFSHVVPGGFGTADAIVIKDTTLHVIDLKYGRGVRVEAENNPQAMLYALGALNDYGYLYEDIEQVCMTIVQPRLDHISEHTIGIKELEAFAQEATQAAQLALSDNAPARPSESACRFCKAKGECRALAEQAYAIATEGFTDLSSDPAAKDVQKIGVDKLSWCVSHIDLLKSFISAVEERAVSLLTRGEDVPGYKLVEGRSIRKWDDEETVEEALRKARVKVSDFTESKLKSPSKLEKIIGKDHRVIKEHVVKPDGKPTLAPVSDKRPALNFNPTDGFTAINQ